uniref:Zinc finger MYMtype protein 1like [Oreochromis niloticus] n=1 Tax=Lepeophtheirus salmonis TaxID=72036 RepID=A0A0K2UXL6_LEPSM
MTFSHTTHIGHHTQDQRIALLTNNTIFTIMIGMKLSKEPLDCTWDINHKVHLSVVKWAVIAGRFDPHRGCLEGMGEKGSTI